MTDIGGALLDRFEELLRGRPRDEAITSAELSDRLAINDGEASPATREAIRALIAERGLPVRSGNCGYWVCQSEVEAQEYLQSLRGRISGIEGRMAAFQAAWEAHDPHAGDDAAVATDGGEAAEVPPEVREQLEDDPVLTVDDWLAMHGGGDGE